MQQRIAARQRQEQRALCWGARRRHPNRAGGGQTSLSAQLLRRPEIFYVCRPLAQERLMRAERSRRVVLKLLQGYLYDG